MRIRLWLITYRVSHWTLISPSLETNAHRVQERVRTRKVGRWRRHQAKVGQMDRRQTLPRGELLVFRNVYETGCRSLWTSGIHVTQKRSRRFTVLARYGFSSTGGDCALTDTAGSSLP